MTALAKVERQTSLEELAETIRREHMLAAGSAKEMVEHAIFAGVALLEAKARLPFGDWREWLDTNAPMSRGTAEVYMRLAAHRDLVLEGRVTTIRAAQRLLRENGVEHRRHKSSGLELEQEAARLRKRGMRYDEIADVLGVSKSAIYNWTNPQSRRKNLDAQKKRVRQRSLERAALERVERDRHMRALKDERSECYRLARLLAQRLDRAHTEAASPEIRAALDDAARKLGAVEAAIVTAGKLS